jgi:methionyl-tRNA synthetase
MSKSKGNVVYPEMLINRYGLDATRYFLLREFSYGQDAVFSPEGFIERFNFDLCNDLGNLLNRTIGMINKYFGGKLPKYKGCINKEDEKLENETLKQINIIEEQYEKYHINNALEEIWKIISITNKYIDETAPWVLVKEEKMENLESVMYHLVENLRKIAIMLKPVMESTEEKILSELGIKDEKLKTWESLEKNDLLKEDIKVIEKGEPLFVRLDMEKEVEAIKEEMKK